MPELKAKKANKKAEEAAKQAEEKKKAVQEEKKELRRQAEADLKKEDEARVADLLKGQKGQKVADFYPKDPAERKKFIKEWNQRVADYQAELKKVHDEEKAKEKAKEDRRPEVDKILKASGGYEKAQEIRAQLERMKKEGSWKQLYSDVKKTPLPPEIPGCAPGERLEWHRAIPTEVDPWSRPFSWDRPWKQVCAESLSGGVFSCGSQSCRAKSFGSETAFWQHLSAKAHTRGHPDREIIKKWEAEAARGEVYTPLLVDPNWVSGLDELEQQAKLKESMRLTLKEPTSEDEGQEDGEESTGTNDTQISVAQHFEVEVSEEKYVKGLTAYKPPAEEKRAEEGVPRAEDSKAPEEKKKEDSGTPARKEEEKKNEDVADQEKEDEKKKDPDPEDKTTKVEAEDPETEVPVPVTSEPVIIPKPAESKPVEVSTEPSVRESGATVTPTEVPAPRHPLIPFPLLRFQQRPHLQVNRQRRCLLLRPRFQVNMRVEKFQEVESPPQVKPVPHPNLEVCQGCYGTGMAEVEMNRAIRILRTAHLVQVKEEDMNDPVTDHEGPASRLDSTIAQDVSYVKGSHTHIVVELCCSGDSEMKQASRKIGSSYIGVHARMQCADVRQEVVKLLRVASSSMTHKGKKKDCSVHVHVSLPCTSGSPLLNFCTNQVREQHTADFEELLGCLDAYFDACRKYDPKVTITFELPHNNRYWKLCEIKEFRNRFGLDHEGIVSCCQIGLRSVRTGRMIGKRYRVVSNNKQVTGFLHAKFARCRCSEEHTTFSEVNWHQTESYTRKFATVLIRTVIVFRITGES